MVILTQSDTTVGFISQDKQELTEIKERVSSKPFIKVYKDFKTFLTCKHRIPNRFKNLVRRSKKTTFIVQNRAFRISTCRGDSQILRDMKWHYSTSANEIGKNFNYEFCEEKTDIICETKDGLRENRSSSLYRINNSKKVRLR